MKSIPTPSLLFPRDSSFYLRKEQAGVPLPTVFDVVGIAWNEYKTVLYFETNAMFYYKISRTASHVWTQILELRQKSPSTVLCSGSQWISRGLLRISPLPLFTHPTQPTTTCCLHQTSVTCHEVPSLSTPHPRGFTQKQGHKIPWHFHDIFINHWVRWKSEIPWLIPWTQFPKSPWLFQARAELLKARLGKSGN